jgi:hypothetical protein
MQQTNLKEEVMKRKTSNRAKLAVAITRSAREVDGLPLSYDQSYAIEVGPFGPKEIRKALADSEMITSLLRAYPKEMASIINDTLAGRTDAARESAFRIGFTEEAFQENGGGLLFWLGIALFGGFIFAAAAFSK